MDTSQQLFTAACRVLPGGVNSPVRAYRSVGLTPRFIQRAQGSHVYDVDGRDYLDYVCSWGPMILGHNHPVIREAVELLLKKRDGLILGICNGFQALIKLGLVPYGEIRALSPEAPTLTFNTIGRHISRYVYTLSLIHI